MFGFNTDDTDDAAEEQRSGNTFSTGPNPISVGDEWRQFDFGFTAVAVSVRANEPILFADTRPHGRPGNQVPLAADETPFSIGGDFPANVETVWIKTDPSAASNADVQVLAK